jgi:hypothetical protein
MVREAKVVDESNQALENRQMVIESRSDAKLAGGDGCCLDDGLRSPDAMKIDGVKRSIGHQIKTMDWIRLGLGIFSP